MGFNITFCEYLPYLGTCTSHNLILRLTDSFFHSYKNSEIFRTVSVSIFRDNTINCKTKFCTDTLQYGFIFYVLKLVTKITFSKVLLFSPFMNTFHLWLIIQSSESRLYIIYQARKRVFPSPICRSPLLLHPLENRFLPGDGPKKEKACVFLNFLNRLLLNFSRFV